MTTRRGPGTALLVLPVALLLVLAVPVLTTVPLWRDESATWAFSTLGYGDLVRATGHVDRVLLPYYALVHTLRVLGLGGTACRALSLVAACVTVVVVQLVGRAWGRVAGVVAALTLALNPTFVVSATSMRPYALATCCTAVATWLVVRRDAPTAPRTRWWLYTLTVAAAVQLHLFTALLAVPHLAWLWLRARSRLRAVAGAWAVALAAAAPLVLTSAGQSDQVSWIPAPTPRWLAGQTATAIGADLRGPGAVTTLVVVASALLGAVLWTLRGRPDPAWLLAVLLWLWPVAALTALSYLTSPVVMYRYLVSTALGAALLVGYATGAVARGVRRALATRGHPRAARPAVAAVTGLAVAALVPALVVGRPGDTSPEGHPGVDAWLASVVRPGDLVVYRQEVPETGFVAGFAEQLRDDPLRRDAVASLVGGQPHLVVREVLTTGPSTMTTRAHPLPTGPGAPTRTAWLLGIGAPDDLTALVGPACVPDGTRHEDHQTLVLRLACVP